MAAICPLQNSSSMKCVILLAFPRHWTVPPNPLVTIAGSGLACLSTQKNCHLRAKTVKTDAMHRRRAICREEAADGVKLNCAGTLHRDNRCLLSLIASCSNAPSSMVGIALPYRLIGPDELLYESSQFSCRFWCRDHLCS